MKKLGFILALFLFIPLVYAEDYTISNYEVNIKVNEDNSYNIIETITANFNTKKHGIYRTIPLRNEVARADGTKDVTYAKIKNVQVDNPFETLNQDSMYTIKIGSQYSYVEGKKTYRLYYTYDLFRAEKQKKYDEFYFNIIGPDWDTTIDRVDFTITMPKDFDKNKIGFSSGYLGESETEGISYEVNGNVIKGSLNRRLYAKEALTVRIELEEGYFTKRFNVEDLSIIVSLVSLIFSFLLWWFYGKDEKVVDTVEFYPPDNLNSLELSFRYRGTVRDKDVTSLLIYLANKGYVKISEINSVTNFNKNDFQITKIKDYDGNNNLEKIFMDGLFKYGATKVTSDDLYDNFYRTTEKLKKEVMSKENRNLIYDKMVDKKANYNLFLIILTIFVAFILPLMVSGYLLLAIIPIFLALFYIPFYKVIIKTKSIVLGLFIGLHSGVFFIVVFSNILSYFPYLLTNFVVAGICLILMIIIYFNMPKRNKYGLEILGRINGFKNFLETAEKTQLENLVLKNPEYFYEILPYTYVLDISDKWISKFEEINLQAPDWYYGTDFDYHHFNHFVTHTINDTRSFTGSKASSSGGGSGFSSSSSGGGFSGGGSGGGGGGSW